MRDALLRSGRSLETERTQSIRAAKKDPLCHEQERGHGEDEPACGSEGQVGGDPDEFVFEVGLLLLMVDISAPGDGMEDGLLTLFVSWTGRALLTMRCSVG